MSPEVYLLKMCIKTVDKYLVWKGGRQLGKETVKHFPVIITVLEIYVHKFFSSLNSVNFTNFKLIPKINTREMGF